MRIKQGFVMRDVAGQAVVIATGDASRDFHGMVKLNQTAAVVWARRGGGAGREGHSRAPRSRVRRGDWPCPSLTLRHFSLACASRALLRTDT